MRSRWQISSSLSKESGPTWSRPPRCFLWGALKTCGNMSESSPTLFRGKEAFKNIYIYAVDYRCGYPASNKLSLCYPLSLPSSAQVKEILGTEWSPFPQKSQCWLITMEQRLSQCWDAYEKPNPERNGCRWTAHRMRSILQHTQLQHNPGRWDLHIQSAKVCKNKS